MSDEEDDVESGDWHARWREERRRLRQAQARVSELELEVGGLKPQLAKLEGLTRQVADLEAKHASERGTWEAERAVWSAGITDPEGLLVARTLHGALPEAGRPAIGDWLAALRTDPSKAPRPLRPYLEAEAKAEVEVDDDASPPPAPVRKRRPAVNAGTSAATPAGGGRSVPPTAAEWAAAKAKLRSGDRADFDALAKRMGHAALRGAGD